MLQEREMDQAKKVGLLLDVRYFKMHIGKWSSTIVVTFSFFGNSNLGLLWPFSLKLEESF